MTDQNGNTSEIRSFMIEDHPGDTAENARNILSLLRYVDTEICDEAEAGRDLLLREVIAVIGHLGGLKLDKFGLLQVDDTDEGSNLREEIADSILARARRHGFTVQTSDGPYPFQLVGPRVTVEGLAEQVAGLDGADRPQTTHEMIRSLCRGIRRSAKQADKAIADDDLSVRMVSVGKAADVIEHLICNLVEETGSDPEGGAA
ncbi:MAG: hypothetical protein WD795_18085 [Woeseia sp.]